MVSHKQAVFRSNDSSASRCDYKRTLSGNCAQNLRFAQSKPFLSLALKNERNGHAAALNDQLIEIIDRPHHSFSDQPRNRRFSGAAKSY